MGGNRATAKDAPGSEASPTRPDPRPDQSEARRGPFPAEPPAVLGWDDLPAAEDPVLVCGNGPSLADSRESVENWPGPILACNAYWRLGWRPADVLCCWDADQAGYALRATNGPVAVPDGISHPQSPRLAPAFPGRVILCGPTCGEPADRDLDTWNLWSGCWGNLSGHLAFQLAARLRPPAVVLCGIDVAGIALSGGRVRLTSMDPSWSGYECHASPHFLASRHCRDLGRGDEVLPLHWERKVAFWGRLVQRVEQAGIRVLRAADRGALTWLPVLSHDPRDLRQRVPRHDRRNGAGLRPRAEP